MFHVKHYINKLFLFKLYHHKFNTIMLYICIVYPQFKESGIPMHSKQVYAATKSIFEITSTHSNVRTWMYD